MTDARKQNNTGPFGGPVIKLLQVLYENTSLHSLSTLTNNVNQATASTSSSVVIVDFTNVCITVILDNEKPNV